MTAAKCIGKYPVIREIGNGSMGKVYEGFDPDTGTKVAIKILRAEYVGDTDPDSPAARFGREAEVGLKMRHPNIVTVLEYGEQGRIHFIVMEYVEGRELRRLMRERQRMDLFDAVRVMLQLLAALDCSHRHGVVHRDIKPANLMVVEPLVIKLMDFGIARIESAAFTQVGTVLGTPTYMSPEQMCGDHVDARTDLWAAAVIFYEMLTGRVPFWGPNSIDVMQKAMQGRHARVRDLRPDVPEAIDAVLDRALAKRKEDRFQSAREFARALRQAASYAPRPAAVDLDLDVGSAGGVDLMIDDVPAAPRA